MSPLMPTLLTMIATVQVAEARETGAIQGVVEDEDGLAVPNATVVLSGVELAGEITTTTRADGSYRFDNIAPGSYEIAVTLNDALLARAEVRVALQTTTSARITAIMSGVSEEINVVFKPVVDVTQSAFSTSLGEDSIQNLPVGRTYQDVVQTIPGVTGRVNTSTGGAGNGNPSVRGEGQYGNNYTLDGVSTRDPATKGVGQGLNFDAIEEIQVYTDGAPAEFGQFTGMQVNVVTKDGGDEHHGSIAAFYSQHAFFNPTYDIFDIGWDGEGNPEQPVTKARSRAPVLNATAGGPIIPEKLWYFTALDLNHSWDVPEGLKIEGDDLDEGEVPTEPIVTNSGRFLGKLTWFANDKLTLRYLFSGFYSSAASFDASQFVLPEATSNSRSLILTNLLTANIQASDNDLFELRGGYTNKNVDVVPTSGDDQAPSLLDESGVLRNNASRFDYNDRNRFGGGLVYERLLQDVFGNHKIRAGAEYWVLLEKREIINTGVDQIQWIDNDGNPAVLDNGDPDMRDVGTSYTTTAGYPCTQPDGSDCGFREHWTNVGPLGNKVNTAFFFLQDEWQPLSNLTFNLGARVDIEDGRNDVGNRPTTQLVEEFNLAPEERSVPCVAPDPEDPTVLVPAEGPCDYDGVAGPMIMPAPRLGFSWDPFGDSRTKVTGHYGQYYDLAGQNLWSWGNARSSAGFVRYGRNEAGEWAWNNTQDPEGHPLIYDEGLTPARLDKVNVGIQREVLPDLALGVRAILSRTSDLPEDINTNWDDWYIMNSPLKERRYRALEFTVNKEFDDQWQLFGAYTLQEAYGHTPGQFELAPGADSGSDGNNVGVYLDDIGDRQTRADWYEHGLGWVLDGLKGLGRYDPDNPLFRDDAGFYGYLPYHAFHSIKLNGSYTAPFGTKFGMVYEFSSGNAWQKRGSVGFYGPGYSFPQGRGSRFMPALHYVDVRVAHQLGLGTEHQSLEATLDVFNLPGFAQAITYFENDAPGFGATLYRQAPRSIRLGLKYRY